MTKCHGGLAESRKEGKMFIWVKEFSVDLMEPLAWKIPVSKAKRVQVFSKSGLDQSLGPTHVRHKHQSFIHHSVNIY